MSSDVALTAALRQNLTSLQSTSSAIDVVTNRLSTGREVNSVFDDPINFAKARGFGDRAGDLGRVLDGISQSLRTVEQANNGATAIESLVDEAESLLNQAEENLSSGTGVATVTGNADLSGVDDVEVDLGIAGASDLLLTVVDSDGDDAAYTIDLDQNITINQLVAEIDSKDGLSAELTNDGRLKLTATESGSPLRIGFTAAGGDTEQQLAASLGLSDIVSVEDNADGSTDRLAATITAGTTLTSLALFSGANLANASDSLNGLTDEAGGGNTLVVGADTGDKATFEVLDTNGNSLATASVDISSGGATIQGLVDAINDGDAGDFIRASFDDTTGKLSVAAISADVAAVQVGAADASGAGTAEAEFNLNFGGFDTFNRVDVVDSDKSDAVGVEETLRFGAQAGQISQLEESFNTLRSQIDLAVEEAELAGVNLLNGDSLETFFNADRSSSLTTEGVTFTSAGLSLDAANFGSQSQIDSFRTNVLAARESVRGFSTRITTDLNIISTRESFAESTVATLNAAADDLTLADQNEEAAKLTALQTRQQLATVSLSIATQSQQSVLRLF